MSFEPDDVTPEHYAPEPKPRWEIMLEDRHIDSRHDAASALAIAELVRARNPRRCVWISDERDPERGDVSVELERFLEDGEGDGAGDFDAWYREDRRSNRAQADGGGDDD